MGEDQRSSKMGQKVRFMEIPADAGANMGLFEDLHGFEHAEVFASYLQTQSCKTYGTAGQAFIEALCLERQKDTETLQQSLTQTIEHRTQALLSNDATISARLPNAVP